LQHLFAVRPIRPLAYSNSGLSALCTTFLSCFVGGYTCSTGFISSSSLYLTCSSQSYSYGSYAETCSVSVSSYLSYSSYDSYYLSGSASCTGSCDPYSPTPYNEGSDDTGAIVGAVFDALFGCLVVYWIVLFIVSRGVCPCWKPLRLNPGAGSPGGGTVAFGGPSVAFYPPPQGYAPQMYAPQAYPPQAYAPQAPPPDPEKVSV
jgi:hypothetical protein